MFQKLNKKVYYGLTLAVVVALLLAPLVLASDVDVAVVDVTAPTGSVTLAPGESGSIAINMSVTGNQVGTATFEVYRDWTLSGGTFTGSNPQEFIVGPRAGGDPATTFSTTGTVTVTAGQTDGTFTLSVGAFDITNSNATGAKLAAGDSSNYQVIVETPASPSDTTAPNISYVLNPASPDGDNGWYTTDVTLTWTVSEPESPGSLVITGCDDQNITADQFETTYSCSATSDGGSAGPVEVKIKRDATNPDVSVTGVSNGDTYTLGSVPEAGCSTSDATSGVAAYATINVTGGNANGVGSFTATCSGAEDNAGNTNSASATYSVIYAWDGFFRPVENLPILNTVKAGSAVPVKFSLGGDQGLNILASGYPASTVVPCDSAPTDAIEQTVTAGASSLSYDDLADQYVYVWKTDKAWAGTCRQLVVKLNDGTFHQANFQLKK